MMRDVATFLVTYNTHDGLKDGQPDRSRCVTVLVENGILDARLCAAQIVASHDKMPTGTKLLDISI